MVRPAGCVGVVYVDCDEMPDFLRYGRGWFEHAPPPLEANNDRTSLIFSLICFWSLRR